MMRDPKTDPIPAPDPATPTVAAPAPMNLAAESMSDLGAEVESSWEACGAKFKVKSSRSKKASTNHMIGLNIT